MKTKLETNVLLGAHLSIAKGLFQALYDARLLGCNALQIFTKNANSWREKILRPQEIDRFKSVKQETRIDQIASHTSYLINLASPDSKKRDQSKQALKQELIRCHQLEIPYVVLHPGAYTDSDQQTGIQSIADGINQIFHELFDELSGLFPRLLLETTAGQGTSIGHTFEEMAKLLEKIKDREKVGICLDTCHIFAAGYDIRTQTTYTQTMGRLDSNIGLDRLCLIHLNDSKKGLGSRVDRHEHIGKGYIGKNGFSNIMNDKRLLSVPKIIETPKMDKPEKKGMKTRNWDPINLNLLKKMIKTNYKT